MFSSPRIVPYLGLSEVMGVPNHPVIMDDHRAGTCRSPPSAPAPAPAARSGCRPRWRQFPRPRAARHAWERDRSARYGPGFFMVETHGEAPETMGKPMANEGKSDPKRNGRNTCRIWKRKETSQHVRGKLGKCGQELVKWDENHCES